MKLNPEEHEKHEDKFWIWDFLTPFITPEYADFQVD
jgi:hypothetical protein